MITIGDLARNSGTTLRTIRYYEERGLIPSSNEKRGNARVYPDETINILKQIRILKEAGCDLDEIGSIFAALKSNHTKNKQLTLFLRETLTTARNRIHNKKMFLEEIEEGLATVLKKTAPCEACETPNSEKDCSGCKNLTALREFGRDIL